MAVNFATHSKRDFVGRRSCPVIGAAESIQLHAKNRDDRNATDRSRSAPERMESSLRINNELRGDPTVRQRQELRQFLQARRAALKPEDVGLRTTGRRRATGLRREEVAAMAGVGLTWYTWLEQGRDIRVSEEMLERVARSLRLSPNDTAYLFLLAGRRPPDHRPPTVKLDPALQSVLEGFTAGPAFLINARVDTLLSNRLADQIYRLNEEEGPFARNMVWRLFMDPLRRQLYADWKEFAVFGVGVLRGNYASRIGDPEFENLIRELRSNSAEFARIWRESSQRGTSSLAPSEVRFRIPGKEILRFASVRLTLPTYPDHLIVFLPALDKATSAAISAMMKGPNE